MSEPPNYLFTDEDLEVFDRVWDELAAEEEAEKAAEEAKKPSRIEPYEEAKKPKSA